MNSSLLHFTDGYFLSSKGEVANVVNVIEDDSTIYRFTGTAKKLIEKIYARTSYQDVLTELGRLHPEQDTAANEEFLKRFLADLQKMGVLPSN